MKCKIVVGANDGDEGKGMVTASLTKNTVNKNQKAHMPQLRPGTTK